MRVILNYDLIIFLLVVVELSVGLNIHIRYDKILH